MRYRQLGRQRIGCSAGLAAGGLASGTSEYWTYLDWKDKVSDTRSDVPLSIHLCL